MTISSAPPTRAELHEAALRYLSRYSSTETGLRRILTNRVNRWRVRQPDASPEIASNLQTAIDQIIASLAQSGFLNDKDFAEARGKSLRREGRSVRLARARLVAKGVSPELARHALPDDAEAELAAAVIAARRRRLGAFRARVGSADHEKARDLARLTRAGFSLDVASRALAMEPEEAEKLIRDARL